MLQTERPIYRTRESAVRRPLAHLTAAIHSAPSLHVLHLTASSNNSLDAASTPTGHQHAAYPGDVTAQTGEKGSDGGHRR